MNVLCFTRNTVTILSFITMSLLSTITTANSFHVERWTTNHGTHVVFYPAMEVSMLDISIAFAAGSAYDDTHAGLSALTTLLMNEGNAHLDATLIAENLANTGAQYDSATNRDMSIFNLRTLSSKEALTQATDTFAQIINHPDFPLPAFEREKKQLLVAIEQSKDAPDDIAMEQFFQHLYRQHPYAHPINGTQKTVQALTREDILEFYKRYYVAHNAVLVLVGAIDSAAAHELAEKLTKDLPEGTPAAPIAKAQALTQPEQIHVPFPSSQTVIRLGQLGIDHHNPNYFPLLIGNYILGGGALVSRLAIDVREKRGLTYGIESQFAPMSGDGPFVISFSTKKAQTTEALNITKATLTQFINQGPSAQEVQAAKQYLEGSFPLSIASNKTIASLLLRMSFYHLPDDYLDTYIQHIQSTSPQDIKRAFQQQIQPEKLLLVTVGKN